MLFNHSMHGLWWNIDSARSHCWIAASPFILWAHQRRFIVCLRDAARNTAEPVNVTSSGGLHVEGERRNTAATETVHDIFVNNKTGFTRDFLEFTPALCGAPGSRSDDTSRTEWLTCTSTQTCGLPAQGMLACRSWKPLANEF